MVIKEIHELRRDKVSISMVLLTPLFQLIILGYAINMDPHNLPTALGFVNGMVASHLLCHSGTINRHSLNGALLS